MHTSVKGSVCLSLGTSHFQMGAHTHQLRPTQRPNGVLAVNPHLRSAASCETADEVELPAVNKPEENTAESFWQAYFLTMKLLLCYNNVTGL